MNIKVYEDLAMKGNSPENLAHEFLKGYFKKKEIVYPINPFDMLKNAKVNFILRDFSNAEGIYIPAQSKRDFAIVGININRPIQRQRFTAAHELCHHLKDSHRNFICNTGANEPIEKYADRFASELLMPIDELRKQVSIYAQEGCIEDIDVLKISHYFGVSYEACYRKIVYDIAQSRISYSQLKRNIAELKVNKEKKKNKLFDTKLYEQLLDSISDEFNIKPSKFACERFKSEYVFYDSRMEGVKIEKEEAGDIVADLRLHKQESKYCLETNKNIIEIAGLTFMYDYAFEKAKDDISIYDTKELNKLLYSTAPHPECTGNYRQSNTLVEGAKFETVDYNDIPKEMMYLGKDIDNLLENNNLSCSEYIEMVVRLHHRMTVIHPFSDGNGRTSRSFSNMLLLRRDIPPIFFTDESKNNYKKSLKLVDTENIYDSLYEDFYKSILKSFALLTKNI